MDSIWRVANWGAISIGTGSLQGSCPYCRLVIQWQMRLSFQNHTERARTDLGEFIALLSCPRSECFGLVLAKLDGNGKIVDMLPSYSPPLETMGIPVDVMACLQEAACCFTAKCYKAAAIMIRRTLEFVCADKGANGANLHQRLASLRQIIQMPSPLFDAMDNLKLMGNDAAHLEARVFEDIGKAELEIAFKATQAVLRSVYQYQELTNELNSLKRQTSP